LLLRDEEMLVAAGLEPMLDGCGGHTNSHLVTLVSGAARLVVESTAVHLVFGFEGVAPISLPIPGKPL
jgi:hypothetical protein